jgi:hypothetical protein
MAPEACLTLSHQIVHISSILEDEDEDEDEDKDKDEDEDKDGVQVAVQAHHQRYAFCRMGNINTRWQGYCNQ